MDKELLHISKQQLSRLKKIYKTLDEHESWEPIQEFMAHLNQILVRLDLDDQKLAISSFSEILTSNLLSKGCEYEDVVFIQKKVEENWMEWLRQHDNVEINIKDIIMNLIQSWSTVHKEIQREKRKSYKIVIKGIGRLITGTAGMSTDIYKWITISTTPDFVYMTIIASCSLFWQGIDDVFKN